MRVGTATTMFLGLVATSVLPSCGSSWTLREEDELPVGCILKNFHPDKDGDGWGEAGSASEALCAASVEQALTASNALDCNDDVGDGDEVTGRTGALCPENLLPDGTIFRGMTIADSEYIAVHSDPQDDSAVVRFTEAATACADWAGQKHIYDLDAEGQPKLGADDKPIVELEPAGGLATFDANADIVELQDIIQDEINFNDPVIYAGWIGIGWKENDGGKAGSDFGVVCELDGDLCDPAAERGGVWGWVDDSPQNLVGDFFDFCDGWGRDGPDISAFWPDLNPNDPKHRKQIEEEVENVRLALIYKEGDWCLGVPDDAIPLGRDGDTDYHRRGAHMICERDKPDPADFESLASEG